MKQEQLVILGAGESGVGAALLGKAKGYKVFVSDNGEIGAGFKKELLDQEIVFEEGGHDLRKIAEADVLVKSPGIPDNLPWLVDLKKEGINAISEIEFASWFCEGVVVAVTGSNGKTTTTSLIFEILKRAKYNVAVGGNIGKSFARLLIEQPAKCYVLELSSFQLDGIEDFQPNIAVLMNITPDHLDRYDYKFENYIESKFRIGLNQSDDDWFIYCQDDEVTVANLLDLSGGGKAISFSLSQEDEGKVVAIRQESQLLVGYGESQYQVPTAKMRLKGIHNHYNAMAAGLVAQLLQVPAEIAVEAIQEFKSLPHRMESVRLHQGVEYINDSKATNVDSVWYALDAFSEKIVWIVGGTDKGNDYSEIEGLVSEKVDHIIAIGVDNSKILKEFSSKVQGIHEVAKMETAVELASTLSQEGDTVLLSPACASFDRFKNYIDRGDQFRSAVMNLS